MRTVTLADGTEMATNEHDGGVFSRRKDGTWSQWAGNGQTPTFRDGLHFMRWVRRHFGPMARIATRSF